MTKKILRRTHLFNSQKFIITLLLLGAAWGVFRFYPRETAPINLIGEVKPLKSGSVILSGKLLKDSPAGESGSYILITTEGNTILLSISDADPLIGQTVTVAGELSPAKDTSSYPILSGITEISAFEE